MKKIKYTRRGYIDMAALLDEERCPFVFITGARGAGKTYGAIDYAIRHQDKPFILMRRTQVQADFAGSVSTTPLAANLRQGEYLQQVKTGVKNMYQIDVMQKSEQDDILIRSCIIIALSTVSSMRGIDLSRCGMLIFDEFIKEPHEKPIRSEYLAFINAIETINRNREKNGEPPLRVVALSNALDLANPYYRGFDVVNEVYRMTGEIWRDPQQGLAIYRPESREFLDEKRTSALYQLKGADAALGNEWSAIDLSRVRSLSLKRAAPLCSINGVGLYKINHVLFASMTQPGDKPAYNLEDRVDRAAVHRKYQGVINLIFARKIVFESVDVMLRVAEFITDL